MSAEAEAPPEVAAGPLKAWWVEVERTEVTEAYVLAPSREAAEEAMRALLDRDGPYFHWDATEVLYSASEVDPAKYPSETFVAPDGRDVKGSAVAELLAEAEAEAARLRPIPGQYDIFGGIVE